MKNSFQKQQEKLFAILWNLILKNTTMDYYVTGHTERFGICISFPARDDEHAKQMIKNDKFFSNIRGTDKIELFTDFNKEILDWETKLNFNL